MQQTDVVLYDRLIGDGILNLVRRDAERIYVGKLKNNHTVPQDEIGEMLIDLAQQGKRVLRLKGGDPFVFGRGGEEIEALSDNGIAFQVVPGVTAANGCAAYAGIPLTHRDHAQACVFVTGHEKDGELNLNWKSLIQPRQTVVLYMGLSSLDAITSRLYKPWRRSCHTGSRYREWNPARSARHNRNLESLLEKASEAEVKSPALIIVGSVVTLRGKLSWFANRPKGD